MTREIIDMNPNDCLIKDSSHLTVDWLYDLGEQLYLI